jgi:hypothetical protein
MGCCCSIPPEPASPPIPEGKIRICVAGTHVSPHVSRARQIAAYLAHKYPDQFETWFYFLPFDVCCCDGYFSYIQEKTKDIKFPPHLKGHSTTPLVWLLNGPEQSWTVLGGRSEFFSWAVAQFPQDKELQKLAGYKFSELCHDCKSCCCSCCCCGYDPEDPFYSSTCGKGKYATAPLIKNAH